MEKKDQNQESPSPTIEKHAGFLGHDAEMRTLQNGSRVVNLNIYPQGQDKPDKDAAYIKTAFWNDLADCVKSLPKGQKITFEGEKKNNVNSKDGKTFNNEYIEVKTFALSSFKDLSGEVVLSPSLKTINNSPALEFSVKSDTGDQKVIVFKNHQEFSNLQAGDKVFFKGEERINFYRSTGGEVKQNSSFIARENVIEKAKTAEASNDQQPAEKKSKKNKSNSLSA